jgi:hypothetical protein
MKEFDYSEFYKKTNNIDEDHRRMAAEFERLRIEPSNRTPAVGDTVVVAAGLLDRGHLWIRTGCLVIALGETSIKVRFPDGYGGKVDEQWISPVLITDVIPKESAPS